MTYISWTGCPHHTGRKRPETVHQEDQYLFARHVESEGSYDVECWPKLGRIKVTFHFWHHGQYVESRVLREENYKSEAEIADFWSMAKNSVFHVRNHWANFNPATEYCTPVIERDRFIASLNHNELAGTRRVRNHKRHLIYLQFRRGDCEDWHTQHIHAAQIYIHDENNNEIYKEYFGCGEIVAAWERFKYVCEHLSEVKMEGYL